MFDIGWSEMLVIGVVALIVIGPKELPGVLRALGQWTTKIRRMAGEFQSQFQEAMREAEMADLKKQVDDLNDAARNLTSKFDPLDYTDPSKWTSPPEQPTSEPAAAPTDTAAAPAPAPAEIAPPDIAPSPASDVVLPPPEPAPPIAEKDFSDAKPEGKPA
jgi:sec-independent protein translocase protein TatB